jgi:hypothetical protein
VFPDTDFEQLCRRLYLQARDGAVDPEAAFDLASAVLEDTPLAADAASLARLCLDGAADASELAEATRTVLTGRFRPGFEEEPGWLATLEQALEVVKKDMRACGLPATGHMQRQGRNAFAAIKDRHGSGTGCEPEDGQDPLTALLVVADDAQDAVMHVIWGAWPVCPAHNRGTHVRDLDQVAVWWCQGGGHVAAPIGQWPAAGG